MAVNDDRVVRIWTRVAQQSRGATVSVAHVCAAAVADVGVDGAGVTHSNIAAARPERALSMYDVRMHVLGSGDAFDLPTRRPAEAPDLDEAHALEAQAIATT